MIARRRWARCRAGIEAGVLCWCAAASVHTRPERVTGAQAVIADYLLSEALLRASRAKGELRTLHGAGLRQILFQGIMLVV